MRRTVLLLLLVMVGSVLAGVYLTRPSADPLDCAGLRGQAAQECMQLRLERLTNDEGLPAAALDLTAMVASSRELGALCHPVAHTVGQEGFRSEGDVRALLDVPTAASACEWGMVHGVLASLVESDPAAVPPLFERCLVADRGFRLGCADSFGHVFFEMDRDFAAGVARCPSEDAEVLTACVGGVFMQFYLPVAPSDAPVLDRSDTDLVGLCSGLGTDPLRVACASAAHYAIGDGFRDLSRELLATAGRERSSIAASRGPSLLVEGLGRCERFPQGGLACSKELVRYAVQALRLLPRDEVVTLLCALPAVPEVGTHCEQAATALL